MDTLKCKNIAFNKHVAITVGTLQIHGIASLVEYGTPEYNKGRENYNPALGEEMYREMLVFDENYLNQIEVYHPHTYAKR